MFSWTGHSVCMPEIDEAPPLDVHNVNRLILSVYASTARARHTVALSRGQAQRHRRSS